MELRFTVDEYVGLEVLNKNESVLWLLFNSDVIGDTLCSSMIVGGLRAESNGPARAPWATVLREEYTHRGSLMLPNRSNLSPDALQTNVHAGSFCVLRNSNVRSGLPSLINGIEMAVLLRPTLRYSFDCGHEGIISKSCHVLV